MSYWKTKVVPKLKKLFDKGGKKKGASEACKLFDSSKESFEKEIEEKKADLHPKIIEIYRSTTIISKKLLKEPNESALKENPDAAQSILQDLAKAGFPGAQVLNDAGGKYGTALLPGPIIYLFGKTSTFLVEEPLPEPKQETREISIEETIAEEKTKEPEATPEGEVVNPPQPPPIENIAVVEGSGVSSEEKKEVIPIIEAKKEEPVPIIEAKKEEVIPIEVKQAEVVPIEAKKEVTPTEDKKEEVAATKEDKKEEVATSKENKKEEVAPAKEVKKEEVTAPSEGKKEEVKTITSVEEKKEKPSEIAP